MSWPTAKPRLSPEEEKKLRRKEREAEKKRQWKEELERIRARANRKDSIPLGEVSRSEYDRLLLKVKTLSEKIWSDEIRSWWEATSRDGTFERWVESVTKDFDTFKDGVYTSRELDRLKATVENAECAINRFLDRNTWRNPLVRKQLPESLRHARDAAERRTIMQRMATPPWVDREAIRAIYMERIRTSRETGIPHDVDHIIPITNRKVCGLHVPWNLRVIPSAENRRKSNKFKVT